MVPEGHRVWHAKFAQRVISDQPPNRGNVALIRNSRTDVQGVCSDEPLDGAGGHQASVRDHPHLVADLLDLAEQVGVEEDPTAAVAQGPHKGPGVVLADGVGRGELVEDAQLRVAADGDG